MALSALLLTICLAASAKADVIEDLVFTGTATCITAFCSSIGSGPLTGTYSLDVTTQVIVGAWSFSTPLGVISSSDIGAGASATGTFSGYPGPDFQILTSTPEFFEALFLSFSDVVDELGPVTNPFPGYISTLCQWGGNPTQNFCNNDYSVSGSNSLASAPVPEPSTSSLMLIGLGLVGLMVVTRKRIALGLPQASCAKIN